MTKKIIFIGGVPHSGTSLLEKILDLHENINSIMNYNCDNIVFIENPPNIFTNKTKFNHYINSFNIPHKNYLLMKNPKNIFYLKQIFEFNPTSKFIIIYRDLRDVCISLVRRNDPVWPNYEQALIYVLKCYTIIEKLKNNKNILLINYSDLVNKNDLFFSKIENYLNISNTKSLVFDTFNKNIKNTDIIPDDKEHVNRRKCQLNKPIYNSSRYEKETLYDEKIIYNKYVKNIESLKDTLFIL